MQTIYYQKSHSIQMFKKWSKYNWIEWIDPAFNGFYGTTAV